MRIHEFQAKHLLKPYGLRAPEGAVAITPQDAGEIFRQLGVCRAAVKAQIHAGGRSRAGGVEFVDSPTAAEAAAGRLLGRKLATAQTGPAGENVRRVLLETAVTPIRELYLALLIDSTSGGLTLLGARGGELIEEQAAKGDLEVSRIELGIGPDTDQEALGRFVAGLGLDGDLCEEACILIGNLRRAFIELDASLIEINPLAVTHEGTLVALDVKMVLDDNALFRHLDLSALRDEEETSAVELEAQRHQLNYVQLDGDIGIAANGAGLGLATLDMVVAAKGKPGNFMDIRTTASSLDVAHGFRLLLDNPKTRAILINVHGGGMQPCDTIAEGLGIAMRRTGRSLPLIVRLAGNNADFARTRFKNFGCAITECPDMWTAASKAVAVAAKGA